MMTSGKDDDNIRSSWVIAGKRKMGEDFQLQVPYVAQRCLPQLCRVEHRSPFKSLQSQAKSAYMINTKKNIFLDPEINFVKN